MDSVALPNLLRNSRRFGHSKWNRNPNELPIKPPQHYITTFNTHPHFSSTSRNWEMISAVIPLHLVLGTLFIITDLPTPKQSSKWYFRVVMPWTKQTAMRKLSVEVEVTLFALRSAVAQDNANRTGSSSFHWRIALYKEWFIIIIMLFLAYSSWCKSKIDRLAFTRSLGSLSCQKHV